MWVTHNPYFCLITIKIGVVVTDLWKEYLYRLRNRNKEKILSIRMFMNVLNEDIMENLYLNLFPDDVSRK